MVVVFQHLGINSKQHVITSIFKCTENRGLPIGLVAIHFDKDVWVCVLAEVVESWGAQERLVVRLGCW